MDEQRAAVRGGDAPVQLHSGRTVCLSDTAGNITAPLHGVVVNDTRLLSRRELGLGAPTTAGEPAFIDVDEAVLVAESRGVVVATRRTVGQGVHDEVSVAGVGDIQLELRLGCDFADVLEMQGWQSSPAGPVDLVTAPGQATFVRIVPGADRLLQQRSTITWGDGWSAESEDRTLVLRAHARPGWRSWVAVSADGATALSDERGQRRSWIDQARRPPQPPGIDTNVTSAALTDVASLLLHDLGHEDPVIAAGAPWFLTLFGRDALLASWMLLDIDPRLALGALAATAAWQGREVDTQSEEEPGKILHELRLGRDIGWGARPAYYGSIDSTPLFVALAGEVARRLGPELVEPLLPAVEAALHWITRFADVDGDGYVEYETSGSLRNKGWKDSANALRHRDGRDVSGPIALCEVQGYVYAAYTAGADLVRPPAWAAELRARASTLRQSFNRDFWLPDESCFALALDGNKRPVATMASNVGHCLWSGISSSAHATLAAERLMQPDMFSGWGIRTLSSSMTAYDPRSYHNGSVWPHDTALAVAGLARYDLVGHCTRLGYALLEAASALGGRMPELFAGHTRVPGDAPERLAGACSPQAWSAAAPLYVASVLARFNSASRVVDVPAGRAATISSE